MSERVDAHGVPGAYSPLEGLEPLNGQMRLAECIGLGALIVRGSGGDFHARAAHVLGVPLPTWANTTWRQPECVALWLGPDEWLIRLPLAGAEACATALRATLAAEHAAVVNVSDRACVLRLSGRASRAVLAQGCPLDLHPRVFVPGTCAQSHYLKAAILIDQVDAVPTYDVHTPRSCARYLWQLLVEAAWECELERCAPTPNAPWNGAAPVTASAPNPLSGLATGA